jgi:hypothetical protein
MLDRPSVGSHPWLMRVAGLMFVVAVLLGGATAVAASSVGATPADKHASATGNNPGKSKIGSRAPADQHANAGGNGRAHQVATDPQPPSNADFSGHGANTHGPYDSTRDGSPSGNGNGTGLAVGKPCAGCVGKAGNKNPKGQLPGGSDANAGYECDRNHGIGRSNPAHTGCRTVVTPPTSPPPTSPPSGISSPAPVGQLSPGQAAGSVAGSIPPAHGLASTGVPVLQMLGLSLIALLIGTGLAVAGRTRRRRAGSG